MTPGRCSPTGLSSGLTSGCACPVALASRKQGTPGRLPPCRLVGPVKEGCAGQVPPRLAQPSSPGRPPGWQPARGSMPRGCTGGWCPRTPSRPAAVSGRGWPGMHSDRLAHGPACPRHPVTADCPVDCLAPLLPARVLGRLARAEGRRGEPVASCGVPATVGDVVRLYRQGQARRDRRPGGQEPPGNRAEPGFSRPGSNRGRRRDRAGLPGGLPAQRDIGPGAEPARPRRRPRRAGGAMRAAGHGRRRGPPVPAGPARRDRGPGCPRDHRDQGRPGLRRAPPRRQPPAATAAACPPSCGCGPRRGRCPTPRGARQPDKASRPWPWLSLAASPGEAA